MIITDLPPAVYDYEPVQDYAVAVLPETAARRVCGGGLACAIPKRRLVIVADTLKGEELARVLRHERAHMNGWIH